jgi:hypothetical protein
MPPVPSRGALARAAGSATVAAGIVRLRIVCSGERSCAGTAVLVSGVAGRITRFGQARFDLGPGASEMLRIPVGKRCRQLLAEARGGTLVARLEGHGIEHRRVLLRSAA